MPLKRQEIHKNGLPETGILYLIGVPYGNAEELTIRAKKELEKCDHILVEDTRNWAHLSRECSIQTQAKIVSFNKESETGKTPIALEALKQGESVAIVSDAGLPILADPGLPLVQGAAELEIPIAPVAFGSPALAALAASGFVAVPFYFEGFLPRSSKQRQERLQQLANMACTTIVYEAPHRILSALEDAITIFGPEHNVCLAREISKTYETFWRGSLEEVLSAAQAEEPKGALILVLEAKKIENEWDAEKRDVEILQRLEKGISAKQIRDELVALSGLGKREIYQRILELKDR
jgi:16S rRNA (cytidine1402-2'-O)-methyltransferase